MDKQKVFNVVKTHLLAQNAKAQDADKLCVYRAPNGRKCAIGALIPDDKYEPIMEGQPLSSFRIRNALEAEYGKINDMGNDLSLLSSLMDVHDGHTPDFWAATLDIIAERFKLQA